MAKFGHFYSLSKNGASMQKVASSTYVIMIAWFNPYIIGTAPKIFTVSLLHFLEKKVMCRNSWKSVQMCPPPQFNWKMALLLKSGIIYLCYNDSLNQPLHIWYCTKIIHRCVLQCPYSATYVNCRRSCKERKINPKSNMAKIWTELASPSRVT